MLDYLQAVLGSVGLIFVIIERVKICVYLISIIWNYYCARAFIISTTTDCLKGAILPRVC